MPDDTTAALQALLQQVETLTSTVTDQAKRMDGLHSQNERLLDQVKDAKRDKAAHELAAQNPDSFFAQQDKADKARRDKELGFGAQPPHVLSREDARNPAKYKAAKEAAATAGVALTIDRGEIDPTIRNTKKHAPQGDVLSGATHTLDDDHTGTRFIRADMHTGEGLINRQLAAEKAGYKIRTFKTLDDLPAHVQTKYRLVENAAQATLAEGSNDDE